jgi:metal-responsive CopG/Arc/MetJ family transcriptional regulator
MSEKERVHFLSPKRLLNEFDRAWRARNYRTRTAAYHSLMRKFVRETKKEAVIDA